MRGSICALLDRRASSDGIRISAGRDTPRREPRRPALRGWRDASLLLAALIALASTRPGLADPASDDASALLAQMSVAVRDISYQGSFIYEHNGRIDALRLFHAGGRDERERLFSMSGARSEIVRDGNTVTCLQTGSPTLLLPNHGAVHLLPLVPDVSGASFGKLYSVEAGAQDRVAGYRARIVKIVPLDAYRYGYQLWLEDTTRLPLRSVVVDAAQHELEQFMFVALDIGAKPKESDLLPSAEAGSVMAPMETALVGTPQWRVTDAPAGFEFLRAQRAAQGTNPGEHLIYSDGVASVSVYVEPRDAKAPVAPDRAIARGVLSMYTHDMETCKVTVLGDVPRATVQRVARSVQAVPAAAGLPAR